MLELSEDAIEYGRTLARSLPLYCEKFLKIKDKRGQIVPFKLNKPQEYLHERLEDQIRRTGRVRAFVLKGRQEGCTTYIKARFFHKIVWKFGTSSGTLSHLSDTTDKLWMMVKRFLDNLPALLRPATPVNNSREIKFSTLDSDWSFGTAGTDEVGRGGTLQMFHGSEVAFYPHPEKIRTGILQAVADLPDTEVIFESTANGMDAFFYQMCMQAIRKVGDYELVFIPWFWMEEYRKPVVVGEDLELTEEEEELKELYKLDDEQINWRRSKIVELGSIEEFRKEYPCNPIEAFQTSGDSFIKSEAILRARKNRIEKEEYSHAPLIMGVDPSRTHDRTVVTFRRGRKIVKIYVFDPKAKTGFKGDRMEIIKDIKLNQMTIAGIVSSMIDRFNVDMCNIDVGEGWGIVDRLHERGYKKIVNPVLFHEQADEPLVYANRRAEIWHRLRDWIEGEDGTPDIPDEDAVQADVCSMPRPEPTSNARLRMVPKKQIIAKYGMSPDIAESIALTLANLTARTHPQNMNKSKSQKPAARGLKTLSKKRGAGQDTFSAGNIFARADK